MAVLRTSPALRRARRSSGSITAAAALASLDEREESPAAPRLRDESAYIDTFPGKKRRSCENCRVRCERLVCPTARSLCSTSTTKARPSQHASRRNLPGKLHL